MSTGSTSITAASDSSSRWDWYAARVAAGLSALVRKPDATSEAVIGALVGIGPSRRLVASGGGLGGVSRGGDRLPHVIDGIGWTRCEPSEKLRPERAR